MKKMSMFMPFHTQVENTDAESVNDLKQGTLCATGAPCYG